MLPVEDDGEYVSFKEIKCKATRHPAPTANKCVFDGESVDAFIAPDVVMSARWGLSGTCEDSQVWIGQGGQQAIDLRTHPINQIRFEGSMPGSPTCEAFDVRGTLTKTEDK